MGKVFRVKTVPTSSQADKTQPNRREQLLFSPFVIRFGDHRSSRPATEAIRMTANTIGDDLSPDGTQRS